jgi:DNA-binding MarR family transcriptional regulator
MITKVPDVPRLLDRLEKAELITRERDPNDRRHVTARITAKGRQILEDVGAAPSNPIEKRFSQLGQEQLQVLIEALDLIRQG